MLKCASHTDMSNARKGMKGFECCLHTCVPNGCVNVKTDTPLWRREGGSCSRHTKGTGIHSNCSPVCPGHAFLSGERSGRATRSPTEDELRLYIPHILQEGIMSLQGVAHDLEIAVDDVEVLYKHENLLQVDVEMGSNDVHAIEDLMDVVPSIRTECGDNNRYNEHEHTHVLSAQVVAHHSYTREPSVVSTTSATTTYSQLPQSLSTGQANDLKEDRMFRILYVADPSRRCDTLVEAQHDLGYTTRSIARDLFDMLKKRLPRHIFARRGAADNDANSNGSRMMRVHISKWVSDAQHCYRSLAERSTLLSYG